MPGEIRVVDNRVFLLGLDKLYRGAMKRHERTELLGCARRIAEELDVAPAAGPVEGYYAEDERLTEYFLLVRALQDIDGGSASSVSPLPEFRRLLDVVSSPLFGFPEYGGKLLPAGRDALSQALIDTFPAWTVSRLTATAHTSAVATGDISLVGLAARAQDAVVLAATRESVVLYAEPVMGAALEPPQPQYVWKVDDDLAEHARRFVDTFNALFGEELPPPDAEQAEIFWDACKDNRILGRCVRLGFDDSTLPVRHYHWAIRLSDSREMVVQDFWNDEVWTTARYWGAVRETGRFPEF